MGLRFSVSGEKSLRKENLNEQQVKEAVEDEKKMLNYDPITDSTIVLGRTQDGETLVVVVDGEDVPPAQDDAAAPADPDADNPIGPSVVTARHALPEEIDLLSAEGE